MLKLLSKHIKIIYNIEIKIEININITKFQIQGGIKMKPKQLSSGEVAIFCEQIAMIVRAGIPIGEGIAMMKQEVVEERLKYLLAGIQDRLEDNQPFAKALEEVGSFPQYMVRMVGIGFESGKADEVMELLEKYYYKEENIKQSLRRVVTYPIVLIGMMSVVVLVLSTKVLPIFEEILANLGMQMSGTATQMMQIGTGISQYSVGILLILLVGGLLGTYLVKQKNEGIAYKLLMKSKTYEKLAIQRFASAMSLMISSGMDTEYAMNLAGELVEHEVVKEKVRQCIEQIGEGNAFTSALGDTRLFSELTTRMLVIGTKTGYLDQSMQKVAQHYEDEVEESLGRILAKVEPTAIIILAIVIGSILLSVMLPLMSIMSMVG